MDNLAGTRFGKAVVLGDFLKTSNGGTKWKYRCDCGIEGWSWAETMKRQPGFCCRECRKKVLAIKRTTHGKRYTKKYKAWKSMKDRCNPKSQSRYPHYSGRGITVCGQWRDSFESFDRDVPDQPDAEHCLIDRIDNNGNYEPGNVRWVTHEESQNNRRCNKHLILDGVTHTYSEWSRIIGKDKSQIRREVLKGYSPEVILRKV